MRRILVMLLVAAVAVVMLTPALAKGPKTRQAAPAPSWQRVPTAPGVEYAPKFHQDVFRYQEKYYHYDGGKWYCGKGYAGPWAVIQQPPRVFYQVEAPYFKTPPGWAKGNKTGWRGESLPPGQAKKVYGTGPSGQSKKGKGLPPGQMKKMGD